MQITILVDNVIRINEPLKFIWPIYIVYTIVALSFAVLYADLVTKPEKVRFLEHQNAQLKRQIKRLSYENEVLKFKTKNEIV